MSSPIEFFKDAEKKGIPSARYVGELYFQAIRGTYTSQARTKKILAKPNSLYEKRNSGAL